MGWLGKWLLVFDITIFFLLSGYTQDIVRIKGIIIATDSTNIDYCNLLLYNQDSILITGTTCYNGDLDITCDKAGEYYLVITSMGYKDIFIPISLTASVDLGVIVMKATSYVLDDVTITNKRPQIGYTQGKTEVQVSNTSLAHLQTIKDILGRAPGVRNDNNGISVIGRGAPEIYIDGKRVNSFSEVEMLQPNEIVSFDVDKNPSAKYAADVTSVVRIRTKRGTLEGIAIQLYNTSIFSRKYSDIAGLRANVSKGKFRGYLGYDYNDLSNKDYIDSYEYNYLQSGVIRNVESSINIYNRRKHQLMIGAGYRFSHKHDLSFQYHFAANEKESNNRGEQTIYRDDIIRNEFTITDTGEDKSSPNILSIAYVFTPSDNHKLSFWGDGIYYNMTVNQTIFEDSHVLENDNQILYYNTGKSNAQILKLEYEWNINDNLQLLLGARYGRSESNIGSKIRYQSTIDDYQTDNTISDDNYAGYIQFTHDLEAIGYRIGLRNENSVYNAKANGRGIDATDSKWFPSVKLYSNNFSKIFDFSVTYTSKIMRPTFGQLNPARQYLNNLSYKIGNPSLKSTINHNATIDVTLWDNLNIYTSYDYDKNPILLSGIQDTDHPEIIIFTPMNIDKSEEWDIGVSYNNEWNWFGLGVDAGVTFPNVKIPFMGSVLKQKKESYYVQISTDFTIAKNTFLSMNYNYQGKNIDLMTNFTASHELSVLLTRYFFKRKLSINLSVNDILRKSYSDWFDKYEYVESGQYNNMDSRNIRLTLRYNFNNYRNVYRRKSNYDQELKRLHE
ncbi:outer membrane beta-barrel family protein [Odoribacter lunatus]|uniref:outer membrane beta-barrel family protein n=1 Tax=Odoribacter lunatus TaxID=2941335 RepID=UPI00203D08A0|nr:outer membrane beta-barrel family protein [Odoribacter lunatus]